MDPSLCFSIAGNVAMPGWLLLALAPRWKWTTALITSVLLPSLLAIAYAALLGVHFGEVEQGFAAFGSLAGVKAAFQNDGVLAAGWIHYLAFDLFIGSWEVRDSRKIGLSHWLVVPCLFFTLMLGPVGLLLYLVLRAAVKRQWLIES